MNVVSFKIFALNILEEGPPRIKVEHENMSFDEKE